MPEIISNPTVNMPKKNSVENSRSYSNNDKSIRNTPIQQPRK
jgi:hypothetical protein